MKNEELPRGISRRKDALVVTFALRDIRCKDGQHVPDCECGKIERRSVGECTVSHAENMRKVFKAQVRDGVYQKRQPRPEPTPKAAPEPKFEDHVEAVYLPFVERTMTASTLAAYRVYLSRYITPQVGHYRLSEFTTAIVAAALDGISKSFTVNRDTLTKCRSILSGILTHAIGKGHFPARSVADNPARLALIPEGVGEPLQTEVATREQVRGILAALKEKPEQKLPAMPLERAAVGIIAFTGARPGECRGLCWQDWDRAKQQLKIERSIWHTVEGTTKTPQSVRFVAVSADLRVILLDLWEKQGRPLRGYMLAGPEGKPVILDNLSKRTIRPRLEAVNKEAAEHGEKAELTWPGWYALRRFHGTAVRKESNLKTAARALGNSEAVAERHYVRSDEVLPDVRRAVNDAVSGLAN